MGCSRAESKFRHALDLGCSVGTFTAMLSPHCERLTSVDVSQRALDLAKARHGDIAEFLRREVPAGWPQGAYDLILFSEVLYFLDAEEIAECANLAARDLMPGGTCVLVNWTGENDLPLDGNAAAGHFMAQLDMAAWHIAPPIMGEKYRIDKLTKLAG